MLDTQTLSTPLSYNRQDVFFVVVYVVLEQFSQLRKKLNLITRARYFYALTSELPHGLVAIG